jgi:transcriptional regulator with XRE-family HTH domain
MLNLEKIGNKISMLRKHRNMKQNDLAEALYVTHQAVSKWENGKSIPSIEILYDLTQLFDVSIDYLLQNTDIPVDDYETLLNNYPRASVIKKILEKDSLTTELEKSFYLLSKKERKAIIEQIVSKKLKVELEKLWHIFSIEEREYILVVIISKKLKYDVEKLFRILSKEEQRLVRSHVINGTYCY